MCECSSRYRSHNDLPVITNYMTLDVQDADKYIPLSIKIQTVATLSKYTCTLNPVYFDDVVLYNVP